MGKINDTALWFLKELGNNNPIVTLKLYIHPYGPSVLTAQINDEERLPENVKELIKHINEALTLEDIFQTFLNERIPKKRDCDETDRWIIEELELRKAALQIGRLTKYSGFVSALNNFKTENDNYYLSPECKQYYYFGYTEPGFINLYEIE